MQGNSKKPVITDEDRVGAIKRKQAIGQKVTKEDIMQIKDARTRQEFIARNLDLFTRKK